MKSQNPLIPKIPVQTMNAQGGLSKMRQLFGDSTEGILDELNEVLAA